MGRPTKSDAGDLGELRAFGAAVDRFQRHGIGVGGEIVPQRPLRTSTNGGKEKVCHHEQREAEGPEEARSPAGAREGQGPPSARSAATPQGWLTLELPTQWPFWLLSPAIDKPDLGAAPHLRCWGHWQYGIPIRSHHQYADGTMCIHSPGEWVLPGGRLIHYPRMAVLWAAKSLQLHLLARDARDEYCGCGSDRAYGVCCRESDLSTPAPERNWWLYQAERRYLREIARGKARTFLGQLFESLVTLSVRSYAQSAEAQVRHLRTYDGRQEVDLIVERPDQRIVAVEIKLSSTVTDEDVAHLAWLRDKLGTDLLDSLVVTTGPHAYRRKDGIAVVPAALLGP